MGAEIEDSIMTITQKEEALIERPLERRALSYVFYLMIVVIMILAGRVFYLDVIKGQYYSEASRTNRVRKVAIKAPRGLILDKYGKVLVRNIPSLDAVIIPSDLPDNQTERESIAKSASEILGIEPEKTLEIMNNQNKKVSQPVLLKENITQDQALIMSERKGELVGITLEKTAIRSYEDGMIFSHVMGYDGKITRDELDANSGYLMTDYIGKSGLEKSYEKHLHGVHGARQIETDSLGNVKKNLGVINPVPGSDLVLNIDEELQKKLYDSLSTMLEKTGTKMAAAAAIDPRNGAVLALVSLPSYDNNLFARGISGAEYRNIVEDKNLPLLNRVTNGEYPPGSTLKMSVAAAALSEGIITPETTVSDSGAISIGAWTFRDWKTHGTVDVRKAIAESCDVFFYSVGGGYGNISGLGMDKMKKYNDLFGFGSPTGIDLPSESSGLIPDPEWKQRKIGEKWYIGDSYHCSIGQGFITATPLQLANYTASLANGGILFTPKIVNRIKNPNGQEIIMDTKVIRKDFVSDRILEVVRQGMRQTVTSGTAQTLKDLPVEAAGKTGTAQFGSEDKTHGWFVSFAPYDNPTIAMAIIAEGGGEGHSSAVPVTKDVYDWYFSKQ